MSARSSIGIEGLGLVVALALGACGKSDGPAASANAIEGGAVTVVVSVDWEGAYFRPEALGALEALRKDNPGMPVTHMLNAAYYTKPDADAAAITREIRPALKEGDEVGLHVHAWKSLLTAAGVAPRDQPSFLSRSGDLPPFEDDAGFDVELESFTVAELRAIIQKARAILAAEKLSLGPSFRAAGWIAGPKVLEAARAEGFAIDVSAVPAVWFDEEEAAYLRERILSLWGRIDPSTQPFWIDTPAGPILEMPDTGAMADYTTVDEIEKHVQAALAVAAGTPGRPIFVHLGVHAETADEFAPRLTEALARLRAAKAPLSFATVSGAAARVPKLAK